MYRTTLSTTLAALALATASPFAPPAAAEPGASEPGASEAGASEAGASEAGARDTAELLAELRTAYRATGEAAEAYGETEARLREQQRETEELTDELADVRGELAEARQLAGAIAREEYRGGGGLRLPPALLVLLGDDPTRSLHAGTAAARAEARTADAVRRLTAGERHADKLATAARAALDEERSLAEERREQRDEVHRRMDEAAALLAGLSPAELVPRRETTPTTTRS
ncbi:hypothetical protein [Streptomyces radicis]|uniref:NlpC/P60 family protein n=1 Tax=Streptomyces radicis TaxID=1750517 RepID=A0A3A9WK14_9ACTN|nr:hypothetical protein [Streptomyces radicis]RKN06477.1 hypothetical protein D7319_22060 [Streptomyces radicis]RKN20264.1 hypothetical protein D7318_19100 [Streptomyces radicis]